MYSVIIPIYNSEKYLKRCIDSVLAQTAADLELILVDDGSKDKSGDICKEYAENDKRVKYIRKENAGVSAARNTGLDNAKGEYIGFVDSDDEIKSDMYQSLLECAYKNDAQIVICDAVTVYSDGKTEEDTLPCFDASKSIDRENLTPEQMLFSAGSACRCVYKRELLEENKIRFPVGIKLSEDRIFNILALGHSEKIYYLKKQFYLRYVISGSAVNKYHSDYFETVLKAGEKIEEALRECGFSDEFKNTYKSNISYGTLSSIYNEFHKDCKNSFSKKVSNVKRFCNDTRVQEALDVKCDDFKLKLIKKKKVYTLIFLVKLRNILKRG